MANENKPLSVPAIVVLLKAKQFADAPDEVIEEPTEYFDELESRNLIYDTGDETFELTTDGQTLVAKIEKLTAEF